MFCPSIRHRLMAGQNFPKICWRIEVKNANLWYLFSPIANFGNQSLHSLSTLVTIFILTHLKQWTHLRFIFVVFLCQIHISSYFGFEILDIVRAVNFENQTVESKQIFGWTRPYIQLGLFCPAGLVKWSSQLPTQDSLARSTTQ